MTNEEMQNLKPGDIVQGEVSGMGYVVKQNLGDRVILVRTMEMSHAEEWRLIQKANSCTLSYHRELWLKGDMVCGVCNTKLIVV